MLNLLIKSLFIIGILVSFISIHEIGHLLAGFAMKFQFVYMEIFGLNIRPNHLFLKLKLSAKTNMYPIGTKRIVKRTIVYMCGGIIINIIIGILTGYIIYIVNYEYLRMFSICFLSILIMPIIPYKGGDLHSIFLLIKKNKKGRVLIPFFLKNRFTPSEMLLYFFINKHGCPIKHYDFFMNKMAYYYFIENNDSENAKKYFSIIKTDLIKSRYLNDKCELFFYYVIIDENLELAKYIGLKLQKLIEEKSFSSKKRIIMVYNKIFEEQKKIPKTDVGKSDGIKKLEKKLVEIYLLNG